MKPVGISEQLMFSTVRLQSQKSCGTGYFFDFSINNATIPVIVTNKHVVNYNPDEQVTFFVHLTEDGESTTESIKINLSTHWEFHPRQDLCFSYCQPLIDEVSRIYGKQMFYIPVAHSLIYSPEKLEELSMSESIVMVGYPNGLWDEKHNFPLFRYGHTASHPGYDFYNEGIGVIDCACFPGSSGSPIFILNEGAYSNKNGSVTIVKGGRLIFLGTLFSGPVQKINEDIIIREIPTGKNLSSQTNIIIMLMQATYSTNLMKLMSTTKATTSTKPTILTKLRKLLFRNLQIWLLKERASSQNVLSASLIQLSTSWTSRI